MRAPESGDLSGPCAAGLAKWAVAFYPGSMKLHHVAFLVAIALLGCAGVGTGNSEDMGDDAGGVGPTADLTSPPPPDLTTPPDLATPDLMPPLKDVGERCTMDGQCISNACKSFDGGPTVCVLRCTQQSDCARFPNLYCEPSAVGAPGGFCLFQSANHCSACATDKDCGGLAGRCMQATGDLAKACHIDCSLSGADACPSDYTCTPVTEGGVMRKLCMPKTPVCNDALGGFCDRTPAPQPCTRANTAGVCNGQRQCLATGRYDRCGAQSPQFKNSCQDQDPAGCTLLFSQAATSTKQNCGMCGKACGATEDCCNQVCTSITTTANCGTCGKVCNGAGLQGCCAGNCTTLNTVQNCGACGNACMGVGLSTSDVSCSDPATKTCDMTCRGENYDVNKNMTDGCEKLDQVPPGHTQASAQGLGSKDCNDGSSSTNFAAQVMSDARVHTNPVVASFNGTVGAAPDWWVVRADGGVFCLNDYSVTFSTSLGGGTACYRMTLRIPNKGDRSITLTGSGSGNISSGSGSYSGGNDIYFIVEKICNLPVQEAVNYAVSFHL